MTEIDACEPQIIRALEKAGWQIVEKPHHIVFDERMVFADFSARHINEDHENFIVVIEVKCFTNPKQEYPLYIALPNAAYLRFIAEITLLRAFQITQIKLVIVDIEREEVLQWLP